MRLVEGKSIERITQRTWVFGNIKRKYSKSAYVAVGIYFPTVGANAVRSFIVSRVEQECKILTGGAEIVCEFHRMQNIRNSKVIISCERRDVPEDSTALKTAVNP